MRRRGIDHEALTALLMVLIDGEAFGDSLTSPGPGTFANRRTTQCGNHHDFIDEQNNTPDAALSALDVERSELLDY